MSLLRLQKGNLFTLPPKGSALVHSCNAMGVWGGGPNAVATQMKKRFPLAFEHYELHCRMFSKTYLPGTIRISDENGYAIVSMIVSTGFGKNTDTPQVILKNTVEAVCRVLDYFPDNFQIHSPKINAGLFGVPWDDTQRVIETCLKEYDNKNITWTVWEL